MKRIFSILCLAIILTAGAIDTAPARAQAQNWETLTVTTAGGCTKIFITDMVIVSNETGEDINIFYAVYYDNIGDHSYVVNYSILKKNDPRLGYGGITLIQVGNDCSWDQFLTQSRLVAAIRGDDR